MDLSQTLPGDKDNGEENNQTLGNRKCTMCDYQTSSFSGLQQHLISHARKHLIKCALCGNHYKDYVKMVKHMEFKHPHCRIYKCIFCSKKFVDEKDLTEHIQTHPDRKYFQCPNPACPEQFTKLIEMYEHMKGDHDLYKDESFDNPQIVIEIDTDNEYDDLCKTDGLRSTLEEVNKFNCITCDMKLNTEDEYRQHLIAHEIVQKKQKKATKEKPGYQCQICSMFFVSKLRLNNHLKLHQHCFKCMFCDKLLNSMKKIETHVSSSHQRKLAKLGPNVLPYIEVKYDDLVIAGNNEQFNMINKTKAIVPDKKAKKNNIQQSQSIPTQSTIAMPSYIVNDYKNILHNDSKVQSLENAPHEHHLSHSDLAVTEDKLMLANAKETIEVDLTKVKIEPDITAGSQLMVKEQKTEQSQGARNGSKRKGSPTKYIKRNSAWNDKSEFETGESEIKAEVQEQDNEYFKAGIVSSLNKRARVDLLFEEAGKMRVDNFNKYGPERQYDDMANCGEEHTQYINEIAGTVKQFICPVEGCGKPFLKEKNREKHILINHSGMKPEYFCKACDKYFLRKKEYLIHRRIHEDKKMVECPYCNKMYSGGTNLKAHILTHTGKRPFECKICKRCFTQNSSLRRHLVTHTGIKQFECKFCGKPFARYDDLKTHTRIHTGEKPYVCEVCGRAFTQNGPLIKHREIHEKEGRMSPEKSKLIRRTLPRYPFEKRMDGDNQTDIADSGFLTKVASDSSLYQISNSSLTDSFESENMSDRSFDNNGSGTDELNGIGVNFKNQENNSKTASSIFEEFKWVLVETDDFKNDSSLSFLTERNTSSKDEPNKGVASSVLEVQPNNGNNEEVVKQDIDKKECMDNSESDSMHTNENVSKNNEYSQLINTDDVDQGCENSSFKTNEHIEKMDRNDGIGKTCIKTVNNTPKSCNFSDAGPGDVERKTELNRDREMKKINKIEENKNQLVVEFAGDRREGREHNKEGVKEDKNAPNNNRKSRRKRLTKLFNCERCPLQFTSLMQLRKHLPSHVQYINGQQEENETESCGIKNIISNKDQTNTLVEDDHQVEKHVTEVKDEEQTDTRVEDECKVENHMSEMKDKDQADTLVVYDRNVEKHPTEVKDEEQSDTLVEDDFKVEKHVTEVKDEEETDTLVEDDCKVEKHVIEVDDRGQINTLVEGDCKIEKHMTEVKNVEQTYSLAIVDRMVETHVTELKNENESDILVENDCKVEKYEAEFKDEKQTDTSLADDDHKIEKHVTEVKDEEQTDTLVEDDFKVEKQVLYVEENEIESNKHLYVETCKLVKDDESTEVLVDAAYDIKTKSMTNDNNNTFAIGDCTKDKAEILNLIIENKGAKTSVIWDDSNKVRKDSSNVVLEDKDVKQDTEEYEMSQEVEYDGKVQNGQCEVDSRSVIYINDVEENKVGFAREDNLAVKTGVKQGSADFTNTNSADVEQTVISIVNKVAQPRYSLFVPLSPQFQKRAPVKETNNNKMGEEKRQRRRWSRRIPNAYNTPGSHKCNVCNREYHYLGTLEKHMKICSRNRPHKCPHCDRLFKQKYTLERHQLVHTQERPFLCRLCTKAFSRFQDLQTHVRAHIGERLYECEICAKKFTQYGPLQDHLNKKHEGAKVKIRRKQSMLFQSEKSDSMMYRKIITEQDLWRETFEKLRMKKKWDKKLKLQKEQEEKEKEEAAKQLKLLEEKKAEEKAAAMKSHQSKMKEVPLYERERRRKNIYPNQLVRSEERTAEINEKGNHEIKDTETRIIDMSIGVSTVASGIANTGLSTTNSALTPSKVTGGFRESDRNRALSINNFNTRNNLNCIDIEKRPDIQAIENLSDSGYNSPEFNPLSMGHTFVTRITPETFHSQKPDYEITINDSNDGEDINKVMGPQQLDNIAAVNGSMGTHLKKQVDELDYTPFLLQKSKGGYRQKHGETTLNHTVNETAVNHTANGTILNKTASYNTLNHTASEHTINLMTVKTTLNHATSVHTLNQSVEETNFNHTASVYALNHTVGDTTMTHTAGDTTVNHTAGETTINHNAVENTIPREQGPRIGMTALSTSTISGEQTSFTSNTGIGPSSNEQIMHGNYTVTSDEAESNGDLFTKQCEELYLPPIMTTKYKARDCPICHKTFTTRSNLMCHLRVHSGDTPYKCPSCDREFNQSGSLQRHMTTHSDIRPHVCSYCGRGFARFADLRVHLRTHTGEKPYKCQFCEKSFAQNGPYNTHLKTIHRIDLDRNKGVNPVLC